MTPSPNLSDERAWYRLHLAASALVTRITSGQRLHADDLADLIAAVADVDAVLFSDWWEREHADKIARSTDTHD